MFQTAPQIFNGHVIWSYSKTINLRVMLWISQCVVTICCTKNTTRTSQTNFRLEPDLPHTEGEMLQLEFDVTSVNHLNKCRNVFRRTILYAASSCSVYSPLKTSNFVCLFNQWFLGRYLTPYFNYMHFPSHKRIRVELY